MEAGGRGGAGGVSEEVGGLEEGTDGGRGTGHAG
jgi:hypothetical protein